MPPTFTPLDERSDPLCLTPEAAAALIAAAPWRRFAVVGDSLSAGTGDPTPGYRDAGWSERVIEILRRVRPEAVYLNVAKIGATTADTLDHQIDAMRRFEPDLLHLPCGPYDLLRRDADLGEIERTLRRLYAIAADTRARLVTFTVGRAYVVPAFPDWTQRVIALNRITRSLACEHDALVVDMWDHPINDRDDLLSADGLHFATVGQAAMAAEYIRTLARSL